MRPGPFSPVHVTPLTLPTDEPKGQHQLPSGEDKGEAKPAVEPEGAEVNNSQLVLPERKHQTVTEKAHGDGKGPPQSSAAQEEKVEKVEKVKKVSDAPTQPEHKGADDDRSKRKGETEESEGEAKKHHGEAEREKEEKAFAAVFGDKTGRRTGWKL